MRCCCSCGSWCAGSGSCTGASAAPLGGCSSCQDRCGKSGLTLGSSSMGATERDLGERYWQAVWEAVAGRQGGRDGFRACAHAGAGPAQRAEMLRHKHMSFLHLLYDSWLSGAVSTSDGYGVTGFGRTGSCLQAAGPRENPGGWGREGAQTSKRTKSQNTKGRACYAERSGCGGLAGCALAPATANTWLVWVFMHASARATDPKLVLLVLFGLCLLSQQLQGWTLCKQQGLAIGGLTKQKQNAAT